MWLGDLDLPALAVQRGEVGDTGDRCIEECRDQRHLAGPKARRVEVIAPLSEHSRVGQGR